MKRLGLFACILFFNLSLVFCSSVVVLKPKAIRVSICSSTPSYTPTLDPIYRCSLHQNSLEKKYNHLVCMLCINDFKFILEKFLKKLCQIEYNAQCQQDILVPLISNAKDFDDYYHKIFLTNLMRELKTLTIPEKSKYIKCFTAKGVFKVCFARHNFDLSEPESIEVIANSIVVALNNLYPQRLSKKTLKKLFNFIQEHNKDFLKIIGYETKAIYAQ